MPTLRLILDRPWVDDGEPELAPPPGVSVEGPTYTAAGTWQKDVGAVKDVIISLAVDFPSNIAAGLLAAWLYELLTKHGHKRVRVQEEEVTVEAEAIGRVVARQIEVIEE